MDEERMNTDDLFAEMEADELADRLHEQTKASPIEYARSHGIKPQIVYYWIRSGKLEKESCVCGRSVIDIKAADAIRNGKSRGTNLESEVQEEEEA